MCQLQDLQDQFERHVLLCPTMMDKVLSSIMQQQMDHDCREFIKLLIIKVIENPEMYQGTINEANSCEDFCIRKYCTQLAVVFFKNNMNLHASGRKKEIQSIILEKWNVQREKRKIIESYLNTTFSEDLSRSANELKLVMKRTNWKL
jgi:hypothetical protein